MSRFFFVALLVSFSFAPCASALPQSSEVDNPDWNQWRGPARDGSVVGTIFPDKLDDSTVKKTWRKELGPSYSGPIVAEGKVFVTETRDKTFEVVRALDQNTGDQIWEKQWTGSMSVPFFAAANGSWIRSTPSYDSGRLYVGGILDVVVCLNAEDGTEIWKLDFPKQQKAQKPDFGFASSPLITEDGLYVQAGGAFYKLNKETGDIVWKSLGDGGGMMGSAFSSPIETTLHNVKQIVVQTRSTLNGIDPGTGEVLWSQAVPAFRGMNILTPVIEGNSVFTSSYRNKSWRYDIGLNTGQWNVSTAWESKKPAYMSTPVSKDGHVYMHLGNQRFTCIELASGQTKWTSEPYGKYSSMLIQGDRIVALDQRGELIMFTATSEKFDLISEHRVSDQETWAHVAAVGDQLFVRELNAISAFEMKK